MKKTLLIILNLLLVSECLLAQTKNILHGYLLDEQGLPVAGVRLQALQSMNIFSESDKNGHFQFSVPDLGSQDLKVSVLSNEYIIYNNKANKHTAVITTENQKSGVVNIFLTNTVTASTRGVGERSKSDDALIENETENDYLNEVDVYQPASQAVSLSPKKVNSTTPTPANPIYQEAQTVQDSPIITTPVERGTVAEPSKIYEVQIAATSTENLTTKAHYENLVGKNVRIRNKNGRFVYVVPVNSQQEGKDLIQKLSTSQMEQEGIKSPFLIITEQSATKSENDTKTATSQESRATIPTNPMPEPKVYPVPTPPSPSNTPVTTSKPQFIIQLQSSRFPMNSVAKRMLEADLAKIGEVLYEFNDPNADIKYRYYVMKKFPNVTDAETLRAKLTEVGIQSVILTDKTNINFK